MAVQNRDAKNFHEVLQNLIKFSETVTSTINTFSKVFSEVFHVTLNDGESVLKLKMSENLYKDDFASHLKHLSKMCSSLETADKNPITLKSQIGKSFLEGTLALGKIRSIDSEVIRNSIEQISSLKNLASKFKKIKEDQKKAFETSENEKEGSEGAQDLKEAIKSKLRSFLAEEARRALFESNLETDPETLLTHLESIERSLQNSRRVVSEYREALQTVKNRMTEVKQEKNVDVIVRYLSGIKDEVRQIVQECNRINTGHE